MSGARSPVTCCLAVGDRGAPWAHRGCAAGAPVTSPLRGES